MLDRKETTINQFAFGLWEEWKNIQLITGTDEEHSLRNASKFFFANGIAVLCSQHLEDNAVRALNEVKVDKATQKQLIDFLFSKGKHYEDGLLTANSDLEFHERKVKIAALAHANFPGDKFDKLVENILTFCVEPRLQSNGIPPRWKNNACKYILFFNQSSEKLYLL